MSSIFVPSRRTNPSCSKCFATPDSVTNIGAGTTLPRQMYVYECNQCNFIFQQVPPDDLRPGEVAEQKPVHKRKIKNPTGDSEKVYRCRRCGLPKKGHICTNPAPQTMPQTSDIAALNFVIGSSINNATPPAIGSAINGNATSTATTDSSTDICLACGQQGTINIGHQNSLLTCSKCNKFAIHFNCMHVYTLDWVCPLCI